MRKDLTWEELCEKAKEMGWDNGFYVSNSIQLEKGNNKFVFAINGCIHCFHNRSLKSITIATKRTPEQMLMIMETLR